MENSILSKISLFTICTFTTLGLLLSSCKREEMTSDKCFADAATVRQLRNKPAKVTAVGTQFYIVEEGTIDTRLNPCNLALEFRADNLSVTISGDVKATVQEGICCTDNFVITHISKR